MYVKRRDFVIAVVAFISNENNIEKKNIENHYTQTIAALMSITDCFFEMEIEKKRTTSKKAAGILLAALGSHRKLRMTDVDLIKWIVTRRQENEKEKI